MDKYFKLAEDLSVAFAAALPMADTEDGGTCNLDSMTLYLPRWPEGKVRTAAMHAGLDCWRKTGFGQPCYVFTVPVSRQANARTRQAESMRNIMRERGYQTGMHYQMD